MSVEYPEKADIPGLKMSLRIATDCDDIDEFIGDLKEAIASAEGKEAERIAREKLEDPDEGADPLGFPQ